MSRLLLSLVIVSACVDTQESIDEAALTSTSVLPANPIEPTRDAPGVYKLFGSHLTRLPVSWYTKNTVTLGAGHRFVVRTECTGEPEQRDSGIYVVRRTNPGAVQDAAFNDDCGTSTGCYCATCSKVDMGAQSAQATYDVYAFTSTRTPAKCAIKYSGVNSTTPSFVGQLSSTLPRGGALVDVGAVTRSTDYFEVKTLGNEGSSDLATEDTQMMLFDVGTSSVAATGTYRSTFAPVISVDRTGDLDPRIGAPIASTQINLPTCIGDTCPTARSFVLVGREAQGSLTPTTASDVEVTVALVHGPRDAAGTSNGATNAPFPALGTASSGCGTPMTLNPGRYSAELRAHSNTPYGWARSWAYTSANSACEVMGYTCTADGSCGDCDRTYFYRGAGNFLAMRTSIEVWSTFRNQWVAIANRDVPNGLFGCDADDTACKESIREDFELFGTTQVRACVANRSSNIDVHTEWYARRNPTYAEIKAATFNAHHGSSSGIETPDEHRNMANLLATRGRLSNDGMLELGDHAPFEWAADVVFLQEDDWLSSFKAFHDEAEKQSALSWRYVYGQGKNLPLLGYTSYNALFAHAFMVNRTRGSLRPAASSECHTEPDGSNISADAYTYCYNNDSEDGGSKHYTYVTPAPIASRRFGEGNDVAIMAYSIIMEPYERYSQRRAELEAMIDTIKSHLAADPRMFKTGATNPTSAKDSDVRIILAGDFNMYPHKSAENRWLVRRLREEFGYAVDVAAGDRASYANFYDMHAWRNSLPVPDQFAFPATYTSGDTWNHLDNETTFWWGQTGVSWPHYFPYWARTYHGEQQPDYDADATHERHDAIFLVGKGWAKDDAVRKYIVMHTHTEGSSPFAIHDSQGRVLAVDIEPHGSDNDVPNGVPGLLHYRPQYDMTNEAEGCTQRGCAAVESDHIPVGVRLRVTQ